MILPEWMSEERPVVASFMPVQTILDKKYMD